MVQIKIAVDIGGTKTEVALISKGKIKKIVKYKTPHIKKKFCEELIRHIKEKSDGKNISGIGVSVAGPVYQGKVLNCPHLPIKNFNLKKFLVSKLKKKVEVENDANCFALAELKKGYGKDYRNFVLIAIGTGIGGGIVIDKKLYVGKGAAGEIGHMIIGDKGKDNWGIKGAFEGLASGDALVKLSKKITGQKYLAYELSGMASKGDKKAKKVIDEISYHLGRGFVSISNLLNPDAIILAGGVVECGPKLLGEAKKQLKKYVSISPDIKLSKINKGALIGAAELVK